MPLLGIRVINAQLVAKGLQDLKSEVPRIGKDRIENTGKRIVKQMQKYPPQRAGSRYTRTYQFKNSWVITLQARGISIRNTARSRRGLYGEYVVGDERGDGQAWMHVGNWLLFRDVVDYEMTKLPDDVENHIRLYAHGKGL